MFWPAIAVIVIGIYYFKLEKAKLKQEGNGGANSKEATNQLGRLITDSKDIKIQLGRLMAENEEMKDRLRNLEYLASDSNSYIDSDYQKEQIRLDNDSNKFEY